MTQETLNKATHVNHDITVLKKLKDEQEKNHWVGFRTPNGDGDIFWDSTMQDDFKNFINTELLKAQKMFEEL